LKEFIMADLVKVTRDKAKSLGFAALGIPVGSTLVFKKKPAIVVKTLDDKNKVEYQGKPYSISTLAKQLVGSPVSGYLYFKFEGKALKSLGKSETKPATPESPDVPAPELAGETAEVPEAPDAATGSEESGATGESNRDIDPLAGEIEADTAESADTEAESGE
jgi:hypothetical protein